MQTITVNKETLLSVLKENREKHSAVYEEAKAGYRVDVETKLKETLKAVRNGEKINLYFGLVEPVSQLKDYDRIIAMLEMSTQDIVELTHSEFSQYVQDEWSWKDNFTTSNSRYLGKTHNG